MIRQNSKVLVVINTKNNSSMLVTQITALKEELEQAGYLVFETTVENNKFKLLNS